uniref:Uncharacterized protein n=1 Tax=Oryza rufipogon TaxID=4529 RepID=A0A0E0P6Q6_ORYRU
MAAAAAAEPSCCSSSSATLVRTRSAVPMRESGVSVLVAAAADYMKEYHRELCKRLLYHRFNNLHPKLHFYAHSVQAVSDACLGHFCSPLPSSPPTNICNKSSFRIVYVAVFVLNWKIARGTIIK